MDEKRIALVACEALINSWKIGGEFNPSRDIPTAIAAAIADYDQQQKEASADK